MPKCPKCEKEVYFGKLHSPFENFIEISAEKVTSLGKDWHRPCLRCEKCNKVGDPYKKDSSRKDLRSWARVRMLRIAENHIAIDHVTQLCLVPKDSDAVEMSHIHSIKISTNTVRLRHKSRKSYLYLTSMVTYEFNNKISWQFKRVLIGRQVAEPLRHRRIKSWVPVSLKGVIRNW